MSRRDQIVRGDDGFTLTELLVATTMMLIVAFAALGLLQIVQRAQPEISSQNAKIQSAQVSMERAIRELRQTASVVSATPSSLTIQTYVHRTACGGGTIGPARLCRVAYSCSAGSCVRTASEVNGSGAGTVTTIVTGLTSNDIFTYSPSSTSPTSVTVSMSLRAEPGSSEDAVTLSDGALFRNVAPELGS